MKQSNFNKILKIVQALASAKKEKASVKAELANQSTLLVREMQQKTNRRILAVAIAEAHEMTDAGQADRLFHTVWKQMEANMVESHDIRVRAGAMVNLVIKVQEAPSPLVLPTGEADVFTPIHTVGELELVLRQEMKLVEQLYKQGLNVKAASGLTHVLQELSVELLNAWEERAWALGLITAKRPNSRGYEHLTWINSKPINAIAYKGLEAVKLACDDKDPKPAELVSGCNSLVPFLINASLQHKQLAAIEAEGFWIVNGRMNRGHIDSTGRRDYYAGEEDLIIRQPWFGEKVVHSDEGVAQREIADARNACQELADSAMELAESLHKALGRKAKYYNGVGHTDQLSELIASAQQKLDASAAKREEAFAAKKAGIELAAARDAKESWEIAAAGCNAAQIAQLKKLRKEMGFDKGAEILDVQIKKSIDLKNKPEPNPRVAKPIQEIREERRKAAVLADMIAEIKFQLAEAS